MNFPWASRQRLAAIDGEAIIATAASARVTRNIGTSSPSETVSLCHPRPRAKTSITFSRRLDARRNPADAGQWRQLTKGLPR